MRPLNGHTPKLMPLKAPVYESDGRGLIILTLAAALTTLSLILYSLYRILMRVMKT